VSTGHDEAPIFALADQMQFLQAQMPKKPRRQMV